MSTRSFCLRLSAAFLSSMLSLSSASAQNNQTAKPPTEQTGRETKTLIYNFEIPGKTSSTDPRDEGPMKELLRQVTEAAKIGDVYTVLYSSSDPLEESFMTYDEAAKALVKHPRDARQTTVIQINRDLWASIRVKMNPDLSPGVKIRAVVQVDGETDPEKKLKFGAMHNPTNQDAIDRFKAELVKPRSNIVELEKKTADPSKPPVP
jgi:hypothetical protein